MPKIPPNSVNRLISPKAEFTWTPTSTYAPFTVGGNAYPYSHQDDGTTRASDFRYAAVATPINTAITFTEDAEAFNGATIVHYHWKFGDGTEEFGPSTVKTFFISNPVMAAHLHVIDSNGMTASASHNLNLVDAEPVRVKFTRL